MRIASRTWLLAIALLLAGSPTKGPGPRALMTSEAAALLGDGAAWADSLVATTRLARTAAEVSAPSAIALGYLERHRLGLGSPFRLVDLVLSDPRLGAIERRRLAWAILDRARRGQGSIVEARALEPAGSVEEADTAARLASAHLALIESTVRDASDPRAGELAVRLAYALAAAEATVPGAWLSRVQRAAALARDRDIARADVSRLLRSAQRMDADPLALLAVWRRERWFAVERPPSADGLGPDRGPIERGALALVSPLLDSIRARASAAPEAVPPVQHQTLLGEAAARRLAGASATAAPPLTPVIVSVRNERGALAAEPAGAELVRRARNEETLAAAYALYAARGGSSPAVARIVLDAAVAMRALAQEAAWHPGEGATEADPQATAAALGLASVQFERGVPVAWRPYYLRVLTTSVQDLQRVLPDLSLDGLKVRFALRPPEGGALAIHEPRTRTVVFPIETSLGTIAHELAHDLDWQAARAIYRKRGTYSTDVSVASHDARLAPSLRGLTAARLIPPGAANNYRAPHQQRPAEVFARNVDWFVAAALAREGRSNGYLSAVQDEALTGYASVLPREVGGRGGAALMDALAEMVFVSDATREWFLAHWGAVRARRPTGIVRQAVSLAPRRTPAGAMLWPRSTLRGATSLDASLRDALGGCTARVDDGSSAALAWSAVDSRARGLVRARAQAYRGTSRPAWANSVLGVAPWSPTLADDLVRRVRVQLFAQLRGAGELSGPFEIGELAAPVPDCD